MTTFISSDRSESYIEISITIPKVRSRELGYQRSENQPEPQVDWVQMQPPSSRTPQKRSLQPLKNIWSWVNTYVFRKPILTRKERWTYMVHAWYSGVASHSLFFS